MSSPGKVAILLHMHQPDYRDPRTHRPVMPWARLHALRGYRDVVEECLAHEPRVTINWVPVLLDQLVAYAHGGEDDHLELTRRPADDLSAGEIAVVRNTFCAGNPRMIGASPPYARLAGRIASNEPLSTSDLRDLQVWSTLAWFGSTAMADFPELGALRRKGAEFTEDDKAVMLRVQDRVLRSLPGRIRALAGTATGLSITPYHHPILPLLVDVQHAARSVPGVPADLAFAWPDDARVALKRAFDAYRAWFGREPLGLWPSEGSVSPEVVALAGEAGFRWLCTDQEVLARSDGEGGGYGPWDLGHGVRGFFRDHDLSDRVGFHYQQRDPGEAVAELVGTALERARGRVCVIALDGENPWESYEGAGGPFRSALWRALESTGITLDEASAAPACGRITRLHSGSWIGADFRIWCGDAADHAAWRVLAHTRAAVERSANRAEAMEHVLAAEGSDWFWWFGPEFDTPFADTFDALFRDHLRAAWEAIGEAPPAELATPITPSRRPPAPHGLVTPTEGGPLVWEEWRGAARTALPRGGSMAVGGAALSELLWGWDTHGALWVLLPCEAGDVALAVEVDGAVLSPADGEVARSDHALAWRTTHGLVVGRRGEGTTRLAVRLTLPDGKQSRLPPEGAWEIEAPTLRPALAWWSV